MSILRFQTHDGEVVKVESDLLKNVSTTIGDMIECCENIKPRNDENETDKEEIPIPLQDVSKRTLGLILEWAAQHKNDSPQEIEEAKRPGAENMTPWDREFVDKLDKGDVFNILLATNFLDMRQLMDLAIKKTLLMITGKTVEEMREILGVKDDFTPEQKIQIQKENRWFEGDIPEEQNYSSSTKTI